MSVRQIPIYLTVNRSAVDGAAVVFFGLRREYPPPYDRVVRRNVEDADLYDGIR